MTEKEKVRDVTEISSCLIFDVPEEKGITIILPIFENLNASVFMSDAEAEQLINIIRNKLNARL